MTDGRQLEKIDERLRKVEQALAGINSTQKVIGGLLLLLAPILTAILVKIVHAL